MRKFFFAVILSGFIFTANICSAVQPTRFSDFFLDAFIYRYNQIVEKSAMKYDIAIKEKPQNFGAIGNNDKNISNYMAGCGPKGSGVVINFMTTPDKYITKILIFAKKDSNTASSAGAVSATALIAAGMPPKELNDFLESLKEFPVVFWSPTMNKYIIYEFDESNAEVVCIKLSAAVN